MSNGLILGATVFVLTVVVQVIAVYGSVAVAVFDAFWPQVAGDPKPLQDRPAPA
jgi:hypothetical protein